MKSMKMMLMKLYGTGINRRLPTQNVQAATSEAHELLKKEIAAATADDSQELPDDYFDAQGKLT